MMIDSIIKAIENNNAEALKTLLEAEQQHPTGVLNQTIFKEEIGTVTALMYATYLWRASRLNNKVLSLLLQHQQISQLTDEQVTYITKNLNGKHIAKCFNWDATHLGFISEIATSFIKNKALQDYILSYRSDSTLLYKKTFLHIAAMAGDLNAINAILNIINEHYANVYTDESSQKTEKNGYLWSETEQLADYGGGETALHLAAAEGHAHVVSALLNACPDDKTRAAYLKKKAAYLAKDTALNAAIFNDHSQVITAIFTSFTEPKEAREILKFWATTKDDKEFNSLRYAVQLAINNKRSIHSIQALLCVFGTDQEAQDAKIAWIQATGADLLQQAAAAERRDIASLLLDAFGNNHTAKCDYIKASNNQQHPQSGVIIMSTEQYLAEVKSPLAQVTASTPTAHSPYEPWVGI